MTFRSTLLLGAAFALPAVTPAEAQQSPEPATQPTAPAAPAQAQPTVPQPSAAPAEGAAQPADEAAGDEEEIVVVGAKPRGSVIGDIPPVDTLDSRDVRATGATNINELLDAIAPQIGSAQGRGGERPVLLLNGQRISSFRELRDIPTEAIQRVEILPEEVALKYGYSANQKVVNIVLRQRFRSTVAQVGGGLATDGGYGSVNGDLTQLMIQRNGRTQLNLHSEGNSMLTEAERNIELPEGSPPGTAAARSLIGTKRDIRGSATFNRQVLGDVSATLNTELEHNEGRSLTGLGGALLTPLDRDTSTDSAHAGLTMNWDKAKWHWNVTGNADWDRTVTGTDQDDVQFPRDRARETVVSTDLTGTANGTLFKVPAGNASATFRVGGSTVDLDSERRADDVTTPNSLGRAAGTAGVNVDLPISRRGRDFSALGNLTLSGNAEINQLSDFGTLAKVGANLNWSPLNRLTLVTSVTREEGPPTINQLGDPLLTTDNTRIFDFKTGQTVLVTAITGGNPDLQRDRRTVFKLGGYWKPTDKLDLTLRADYVYQKIDDPISNITSSATIQNAFPDRFQRDPVTNQLTHVDLRPVNFDSSRRDTLRVGFDFTKPLKSRRPSQAVIDQIRQQFGFGGRGGAPAAGGNAPQGQAPATPPAEGGPPPGPPSGEGGGFGGRGFGGRGGGGFGGPGGGNRGRLTLSVTDTITFVDKVSIAPGFPELDYLHGDAAGSTGGTPQHLVEAQAGYFNNGLGARLGANWRSGTRVDTSNGDTLRFSPLGTLDFRLFANPGDIPEVAVKHPWLRGTQVRLELNNIFNTRPKVRDASGVVPLNYQSDLLDPLGRTVMISFRKLFLPSPSQMRQMFQRDRQQAR